MRIDVLHSSAPDAARAGPEIAAQLDGTPDLVIGYFSSAYDAGEAAKALRGLGAGSLHAGTSCGGVLAEAQDTPAQMGCIAISDPDGDYGASVRPKGEDPEAAAAAATREALAEADREGESPALVWLTATPGDEEAVLRGIESVIGAGTPVVGGSAADDTVAGEWVVVGPSGPVADAVAVTVLFPSTPVSTAFQSGYAPTGKHGVVTKADGRRLIEIDGRPAAEVYGEWTGLDGWREAEGRSERSVLAETTFNPLGREATRVSDVPFYLLAHPAMLHADGSLDLFASVSEGETLHLMEGSPESLTQRAGRVARQAVVAGGNRAIAGALVIYCGGCMLGVRDRLGTVSAGVNDALGGAPYLGVFTFGEQAPVIDGMNRHGNLMVSCVAFHA